jgi:peroxiredoxin
MNMRRFGACLLSLFWLSSLAAAGQPSPKAIPNFKLQDAAGKAVSLSDFADKKAVVVLFLGTQCPINNAYMPRLTELHKAYDGKGVQFLAVNANAHDTAEAIAEHAKKFAIPFPVLRDEKQRVADSFKAERVPEAFLLDANRVVRYQGRIDDQFGIGFQKIKPIETELVKAIDAVLSGAEVKIAKTAVAGCYITRAPQAKKETTVTYAKDVSRIMQKHCQECHRAGQIGPMPLLTHDDVSSWSQMISEVVRENRMPPWHADPKHGKFRNDRSLSKTERETLLAWIDAGCPKGDDKDLPPAKKFHDGWYIGEPDAVFKMKTAFNVPAKAPAKGVSYKYFMVETNYDEDKWIQAVEAKPGNYAVVHHIIVYVVEGGKRLRDAQDGIGAGMLVAYAPGDLGTSFPVGYAKKLPKGATLAFQLHYTPNGVEQSDRSMVGLVFAKEPPKQEVRTRGIAQQLFLIPPGADNHRVNSTSVFKKDALLLSLSPHMHLRGKSFKYELITPDGKKEILLNVPHYDFGWQANYLFETPIRIPAGSRIDCTAHFDNSKGNHSNPDPTRAVYWGEQTWEEMMIGFVDYTYLDTPAVEGKK